MATWLKQSTAVDIGLGPFVDATDGVTAETGLTLTQPDIRLKKNGGAWAQKSAAQTLSHEENGWYEASLSATDTDTLGILLVAVNEAGALPVWREFLVVAANVYDSLVGGGDRLQTDVQEWIGSAPNALASGRVDASVGAMAANTLTATAIAADAITAAKIANGAIDAATFAAGAIDAAAIATDAIGAAELAQGAADKVWATTTRALTDKAGFALSAAGVQAIWDALTSALTTASSIGKLLVDNVNATISSRLPTSSYTTPPTVGAIADQVWDEPLAGHLAGGSAGAALNGAGSAGDPWTTSLPGAYGAGTAGKIVGDNLNAAVGSRSSHTAADVWAVVTRTLTGAVTVGTNNDKTGYALSAAGVQAIWDALTTALTVVGSIGKRLADNVDAAVSSRLASGSYTAPPTAAAVADAVWDETNSDHLIGGSTGAALNGAGAAADPWATAVPGAYGAGTAGNVLGNRLDAAVSTRSTLDAATVWAHGARTLTSLAGAAADVWNALVATYSLANSFGAKLGGLTSGAGGGAITYTHTFTRSDTLAPLDDAQVWVTTDAGGSNLVASTRTDAAGRAVFQLDAGTYYLWAAKGGFNFANPQTVVVS